MSKDELRKRFPGAEDDASDEDNSHNTSDTETMNTTPDTGNTSGTDEMSNTPGPTKDPDSTRNRKQVPMYLDERRADTINTIYEQLDARSKLEGDGGIEKHADFMTEVIDFVEDNQDELAERLGVSHTE